MRRSGCWDGCTGGRAGVVNRGAGDHTERGGRTAGQVHSRAAGDRTRRHHVATRSRPHRCRTPLQTGRELHIVTPTRHPALTLPARTVLERIPARWVMRDLDCGYDDGLTGAVLHRHRSRRAGAPAADRRPVESQELEGVKGQPRGTSGVV
ncbi:DUF6177 family protein [Streptomyces spinoverrucosus]|uniref:DUF6177 family protein n=1 Tax=Streptomyces spinoverrucosus TaxID=284043 RepID=UPI0027E436A2|nr:DUF6177 family protein [Streptomyces spinoverrucosus]